MLALMMKMIYLKRIKREKTQGHLQLQKFHHIQERSHRFQALKLLHHLLLDSKPNKKQLTLMLLVQVIRILKLQQILMQVQIHMHQRHPTHMHLLILMHLHHQIHMHLHIIHLVDKVTLLDMEILMGLVDMEMNRMMNTQSMMNMKNRILNMILMHLN